MIVAVLAGGALGSVARYLLTLWIDERLAPPYLCGTIAVNVIGSFLIGVIAAWSAGHPDFPAEWRTFLIVGVLGGFTTFSSFSLQTFSLLEQGQYAWASANVLLSVGLCLGAVTAGHALGRMG